MSENDAGEKEDGSVNEIEIEMPSYEDLVNTEIARNAAEAEAAELLKMEGDKAEASQITAENLIELLVKCDVPPSVQYFAERILGLDVPTIQIYKVQKKSVPAALLAVAAESEAILQGRTATVYEVAKAAYGAEGENHKKQIRAWRKIEPDDVSRKEGKITYNELVVKYVVAGHERQKKISNYHARATDRLEAARKLDWPKFRRAMRRGLKKGKRPADDGQSL